MGVQKTPADSVWSRLNLPQRFMIVVGIGVVMLSAVVVLSITRYEEGVMERKLHDLSATEISSIRALIANVMVGRRADTQNIGVTVFNKWFESRNVEYPGKLWSVWSPKVAAYMHETKPDRAPKEAVDDIDREAMATGKPVMRMVNGFYRYSVPVVQGVTEETKAAACRACHSAMGLEEGEVVAVLSSSLSAEESRKELMSMVIALGVGGVVAAAVAVLGVRLLLGRMITAPVGGIIRVMQRLADGDTAVEVTGGGRHDEIGAIARAVETFKTNAVEKIRVEAAAKAAELRAEQDRADTTNRMADDFDMSVHTKVAAVNSATSGIGATAQGMADRLQRSSSHTLDVGEAARISTDRAAAAAEATQQLALAVDEIAKQVAQSANIAQQAVAEVNATAERMTGLANSVHSIDEIVHLINDIAAQTNLLALNATIEAARAGEAGKGFAVVANEVKNLANQTARATDDIARQVAEVQESSHAMAASITGVVETIRSLDEISSAIAGAVQEQEASTREIASNIGEVANQSDAVSRTVAELAKASARTCAGTVRVIWSANSLTQVVEELTGETEGFLVRVRQ